MSKEQNEKKRRERISDTLRRYYNSEKGLIQRDNISRRQSLRMSKYGEYLNALNENNENKLNNNEESKV